MDFNPNKRRKTQLACHPCRARKTGCDGQRPVCTSCVIRGWQDQCDYQNKSAQPPALALIDIEKRLQRLEGGGSQPLKRLAHQDSSRGSSSTPGDNQKSTHDSSELPSSSRPPLNDGTVSGFVPPSNGAFVREIALAAIGPGKTPGNLLTSSTGFSSSQQIKERSMNMKEMVFPPRHLADAAIECYFDLVHSLCPVLHRPTFTSQCDRLWQSADSFTDFMKLNASELVVFYATFNMVLAVGCQRNEDLQVDNRDELGDEFYQRSLRIVSLDTIDRYSMSLVQLLLLRALYLLYSPYAERCWTVTSVAIGAAYAIGLNVPETSPVSQLAREMQRRVWWCCVHVDRLVALGFGKPRKIHKEGGIPFPADIDDEYLSSSTEDVQPRGVPSRLTFFRYNHKLSEISDAAFGLIDLKSLREGAQYHSRDLGCILDASSEMDRFLEQLPPHLNQKASSLERNHQSVFELEARVLTARVLYTRLVVLRPFLLGEVVRGTLINTSTSTESAKETAAALVQDSLRDDMCKLCVQVAHDVVAEISGALPTRNRTSPWHALYFTFAAASVLVAATLCKGLDLRLDSGQGKATWAKVIEIFRFHSRHISSAEKGLEALEWFRKSIASKMPDPTEVDMTTSEDPTMAHIATPLSASATLYSPADLDQEWLDQTSFDFSTLFGSNSLDYSWLTSQSFEF